VVTNPRASDNQPRPETPPKNGILDTAFAAAASASKNSGTVNPADSAGAADTGAIATLQTLVLESDAIQGFLDQLAHYAADRVSTPQQAVMCGVTLVRERTHTTVASSNDLAKAMDEVQYNFGDGPCLDTARHHRTNHLPDIDDENARWPEYRAVIAGHGLRSILSVPVPLDVEGFSSCAINMYAETPHAFNANDVSTAERLAAEAGDAVRIAVRIAHFSDTAAHLKAAMESRTAIDLAAGIVMAQNRCSQATAVTILKAAASARNVKLHDLAATLISSITADTTTTTHFNP
jgi:hypothetical protein